MATGTPIGALLVRIGADIGDFVDGLNKADKATEKFTRQLDKRLLDPLAKISAAAAAAGAAVFALTKGAADMVDELGKLSQKVGVSIEGLSGLKYAADLNNVSLEQLGTGLKQLSKFMVENQIHGVGVEEQLLRIADEFARTADNENKTAAAMKYFGKSGADLIPLLNQGRAGIEELRKEAERLGIVFSTEAAKKAEEFNDNLTRLKSTVQGLQVEMAGPFVRAFNDAAKALLEAKKNGDGFFSTASEILRLLTSGNDLQMMQREMAGLGKVLVDAQNELDEARRLARDVNPALASQAEARVEKAAARVKQIEDRLKTLKGIVNDPFASPGTPEEKAQAKRTDSVVVPEDPNKLQADREFLAKQLQEQADEEIRIRSETAQLVDDMRAAERAKEKAFQDQRIADLIEAYDREQEAAIAHGQQLIDIDEEVKKRKEELFRDQLSGAQQFFGNLASLMNTSSRKTFEIGKMAALAEGAIKTAQAVINSYEFGTKIGGPYVGAAMAAASAIAGLNYLNNIRQQQFGGGGGAPTPAGQGASGVAAPSAAAPADGGRDRGPDTFISLSGSDPFSNKAVRQLLKRIESNTKDGGRVFVVEPS